MSPESELLPQQVNRNIDSIVGFHQRQGRLESHRAHLDLEVNLLAATHQ